MIIYYVSTLISAIFAFIFKRKYTVTNAISSNQKKWDKYLTMIFILLPLLLLAVLRWNVGVDTFYGVGHYSYAYADAKYGVNSYNHEIGYFLFSRFFSGLNIHIYWYYVFLSIIYFLCVAYFIACYTVNPVVSVILFLLSDLLISSFSMIRQATSLAILLVAFSTLNNEPKLKVLNWKFIILCLLAATFHTSALFVIPLYMLSTIKFTQNSLSLVFFISIIATPIFQTLIPILIRFTPYYEKYVSTKYYDTAEFTLSYVLLFTVPTLLCLYYYNKILEKNEKFYFFINLLVIGSILMINSNVIFLSNRLYYIFASVFLILIPAIMQSCPKKTLTKFFISLGLFFAFTLLFYNMYYVYDSFSYEYQYKTILDYSYLLK